MKMFNVVLVMLLLCGMVTAATNDPGYQKSQSVKDFESGIQSVLPAAIAGGILVFFPQILGSILFVGGVATLTILALQFLGIDIIGWSIAIMTYLLDFTSMMIRWTLASEMNLVSMVILFIAFWAVVLFIIPGIL